MLFHPWRNEDALLNEYETYKEHFQQIQVDLTSKRCEYEQIAGIIEEAMERAQNDCIDNLDLNVDHENEMDAETEKTDSVPFAFFDQVGMK